MPKVQSLVPGETAIAPILASSLWAPQTRSWRQPSSPGVKDPRVARCNASELSYLSDGPTSRASTVGETDFMLDAPCFLVFVLCGYEALFLSFQGRRLGANV
jgi:hypothetical protein